MKKTKLTILLILMTLELRASTLLEDLGINLNILLAGFFGALLLVKKEGKTLKENILTLITGALSAAYLTPLIVNPLSIDQKEMLTGIGFLVGFGGYRIADILLSKYSGNKKEKNNDN